ncbi:hypothetical protein PIROE2DRAFT_15627 [Piromyces sp. E2]|nr:hypothetical protein PIROE2DRAFT_15627 [Piromyces sp. E2]|eukprot:OUM58966.1 hypothetical protein PIROE2DRAFT_15627 [Piromyces sp. E2]
MFILLIFFLISLSSYLVTASNDETIQKLEVNLLNHYITGNNNEVKTTLNNILSLDKNTYNRDKEIIDYWSYIDNKMKLYNDSPSNNLPKTHNHGFVVLGYKLNDDGSLIEEAIERCNVAYESAIKYPNSKIYLAGGPTANNNTYVTEAGQMKDYLVKVKENALNTLPQLYENNIKTITLVTSDYHIRRGNIIFKYVSLKIGRQLGKEPIEILENVVWETGSNEINKVIKGNALASLLDINIS